MTILKSTRCSQESSLVMITDHRLADSSRFKFYPCWTSSLIWCSRQCESMLSSVVKIPAAQNSFLHLMGRYGWCRDFGLVDHVLVVAFSVHGAHAWVPAVTVAFIGRIRFVNLSFVVVGYDGFDISHAAIDQFKRVPVENFVKWVWYWEVLINERKEALSFQKRMYESATLHIYLFSIISELNKEFPAIWLVEQFLIWRYISRSRRFI